MRDLGHPDLIAKDMYSVHSRGSWRDILLATLPHLLLASCSPSTYGAGTPFW